MNFFAYGSLIFEEVMYAVTGRHFEHCEAILVGYSRYQVRNASYPGLIQQINGRIEGVLYKDLDTLSWRQLDRFEGEYYARTAVHVMIDWEETTEAETYVFRETHRSLLSDEPWDSERFRMEHLDAFLGRYPGFERIDSDSTQ